MKRLIVVVFVGGLNELKMQTEMNVFSWEWCWCCDSCAELELRFKWIDCLYQAYGVDVDSDDAAMTEVIGNGGIADLFRNIIWMDGLGW